MRMPQIIPILAANTALEYKEDHSNVRKQSHQNFGTRETSKNREIDENKWCRDRPVNVPGPIYRSKDEFCWVLFVMNHFNEMEGVATSLGYHKVGKCSGERD